MGQTEIESSSPTRHGHFGLLAILAVLFFPFVILLLSKSNSQNYENGEGMGTQSRWKVCKDIAVAVGTLGLLIVNLFLLPATKKAADAAASAARQNSDLNERPWIFAKMPDTITLQVGRPITTSIELFNLSKTSPTMVRASIFAGYGPNIVEQFRKNLAGPNAGQDFLVAPDDVRHRKILLPPEAGTTGFAPQDRQAPLTQQEYRRVIKGVEDGTVEVAVYGRYFYNDLSTPVISDVSPKPGVAQYYGFFCYYLMRDGKTVSACPDMPNAYTNWWQRP